MLGHKKPELYFDSLKSEQIAVLFIWWFVKIGWTKIRVEKDQTAPQEQFDIRLHFLFRQFYSNTLGL